MTPTISATCACDSAFASRSLRRSFGDGRSTAGAAGAVPVVLVIGGPPSPEFP
ncbi:hypothetical protein [Streptomyces cremeus]|uniref:hypothetical protein n=1 Tax=Streptomyces cremeus TaxID=66881 RepID=UPI0031E658A5